MDREKDELMEELETEAGEEEQQGVKVGEKIRKLRDEKGISLQMLAERTGFSSALLSQMENHMMSPPLGVLIKIAKGLDVEIGSFFDEMHEAPFTIVRASDRKTTSRVTSKEGVRYGYSYESLAFEKKGRHMEPFLVTLEPATVKDRHTYSHEGEEFIFVIEGKMQVQLGEHTDVLEPGDCIYFDSIIPHLVSCMDDRETRIIACIYTGQQIK
jgi:transcriptional regulator with XRE-family HTH domain